MTKPNLYVFLGALALLIAGVVLYALSKDAPAALLVGAAIGVFTGNVSPSGEAVGK